MHACGQLMYIYTCVCVGGCVGVWVRACARVYIYIYICGHLEPGVICHFVVLPAEVTEDCKKHQKQDKHRHPQFELFSKRLWR